MRNDHMLMLLERISRGEVNMTRAAAERAKAVTGVDPASIGIKIIEDDEAERLSGHSVHIRCSEGPAAPGMAAEIQQCSVCAQSIWVGENLVKVNLPRLCTFCIGKEMTNGGKWKH